MPKQKNIIIGICLLISGALLPLAFAPFDIYPIAVFSPAILFLLWINATPKQAIFRGLLFGIGFFAVGASWVYVSIYNFGAPNIAVALLITISFVLILSLFPARKAPIS